MPTFVSEKGVFHPAKESVNLVYQGKKDIARKDLPAGVTISSSKEFLKTGDSFLYDGPDRAALAVIFKETNGDGFLGNDFRNDPEFIQSVRNRGFNSVEEYLKAIGYDEAKDKKKFEEKISRVQAHEVEKKVNEIEVLAGGKDYSGSGNDIIGGFGEEQIRKPSK
jgi:hypothetical protein